MYSRNQITLNSVTLHTAAISTAWSWLDSAWNNQTELYLSQKHIVSWEYITATVTEDIFEMDRKMPGGMCSVLHLSSACFFTPAPTAMCNLVTNLTKISLKTSISPTKKVRKAACSSSLNRTGKVLMTHISAKVHYNETIYV